MSDYKTPIGIAQKTESSMPNNFDILTADVANNTVNASTGAFNYNGWYGIDIISPASFPDDTTGCIVNGTGKNLAALNDTAARQMPAVFHKITISAGKIIAYRDTDRKATL